MPIHKYLDNKRKGNALSADSVRALVNVPVERISTFPEAPSFRQGQLTDKYNDKCFLPRWSERKEKENENGGLMKMNSRYLNYTSDAPKGEKED